MGKYSSDSPGASVSRLRLTLGLLLFAVQHQAVLGACCDSASTCESLRAATAGACTASENCATLELLARTTLRLHNNDMSPLTLAQKDLAGTYRIDLPAMRLVNEWAVGDAPGITRPGRSVLSVRRICTESRQIEVTASLVFIRVNIAFDVRGSRRQVEGRTIDGFEAAMDGIRYFLSRAP